MPSQPNGGKSLGEERADLAKEWHPTRNGSLTPFDVTVGSHNKVWWNCDAGPDHEWQASVGNRTLARSGCPFCAGLRVSVTNSLAGRSPELAAQWHPSLNGELTPHQVVSGAARKVWWKCEAGPDHEWEATLNSRWSAGSNCPFCAGQRVSVTNSIEARSPELAAQWHPQLNGALTPDQVVGGSQRKFWWKCDLGSDHEWEATPANRSAGFGCPYCAGKRPSVTNSLARFPELVAQWHPTRNGDLTPNGVVAGSGKKVWWKCDAAPDHEWQATVASRTLNRSGCPSCVGRQPSVTNSLARFPELVAQWHPTRNGDLTPNGVVAGAAVLVWWKCSAGPDHEWRATAGNRTGAGSGCPFCSGHQVSVTNSLAARSPELAAQWHPTRNGALTPDQVVAGSGRRVWWRCNAGPDHEWETAVSSRSSGQGCPFCIGQRVSVTNSLATRFPDLAAQWHPTLNGDVTPDQVVSGSHLKVWWNCDAGPDHEWQATVANRSFSGTGCPICAVTGYSLTRPGAVYVLCGEKWGKVGISNFLAQRLGQHAVKGIFGELVVAVQFANGVLPLQVEAALCDFITTWTTERAPQGVEGYTESFPAWLLDDVVAELQRLLTELRDVERPQIIAGTVLAELSSNVVEPYLRESDGN